MPVNSHSLELRSAEMDELVGNIPPWIIRWGITVLFAVGILGISISCLIKYPDTISAKVLIQAVNQPAKITVSRKSPGEVYKFLIKEGDSVVAGDTLMIESNRNAGERYPIITPVAGKVYTSNSINVKNPLDQIIWVVPKSSKVEIKINYSNKGAGNVKVGQIVQISLSGFPANEYGFIQGRIYSILPIQVNGTHQAYVKLQDKGIITSENEQIPIRPLMEGDGEILLNDRSIFQRIFGNIFH